MEIISKEKAKEIIDRSIWIRENTDPRGVVTELIIKVED